jgi:hypothetical protein
MPRLSRLAALGVACLIVAVAACATRYGEDESPPAVDATAADATSDGGDAARADAEAGVICPVLGATPDSGARSAAALRSTRPKVIDGTFDDWSGCPSFILDRSTAARDKADDAGGVVAAAANVQIEWDGFALYVAIDVRDAKIEGDPAASCPCNNDSVEIYAGGVAATRTGAYSGRDHHYVVDYTGLSADFSADADAPVPFTGATAKLSATGYRIEMKIDATSLGGPLRAGQTLYFDALPNDGRNQARYLIWAMSPHEKCACTSCLCNVSPAFDTLLWAPISLLP